MNKLPLDVNLLFLLKDQNLIGYIILSSAKSDSWDFVQSQPPPKWHGLWLSSYSCAALCSYLMSSNMFSKCQPICAAQRIDAGQQLFQCANNQMLFPLQLTQTEQTNLRPGDDASPNSSCSWWVDLRQGISTTQHSSTTLSKIQLILLGQQCHVTKQAFQWRPVVFTRKSQKLYKSLYF